MEKSLVDIQTRLFFEKKYVKISNTDSIDTLIEKTLKYSKNNSTFLILVYLEIISDDTELKKVFNLIESLPNKIWIMSSTATSHPYYVEPIVNLLIWKDYLQDEIYDNNIRVTAFPKNIWDTKQYNIETKKIKSILSIRRKNIQRDLIYKKINKNDISIFRYYEVEPDKKYPRWSDLVNEYLETYVAFVSETAYPTVTNTTCLTEKSILAFLCGNIPIILGKKRLVEELKEMGFWIANEYFGFTKEHDELDDYSINKVDAFLKCIEDVNKTDIKKFYIENIDKINNNHDIIKKSFSKKISLL